MFVIDIVHMGKYHGLTYLVAANRATFPKTSDEVHCIIGSYAAFLIL